MKSILSDWKMLVLACLTLGLAPFFPEPHIYGKIKWILGGGNGMTAMDWFDVLLHGTPWALLLVSLVKMAGEKLSKRVVL